MTIRPDPTKLTPGVLDGYAQRAFKYGACGALAIAIHDSTGWPIYAVTDSHNVFEDGQAGGGSALHWVVRRPDGALIDVDGVHTADELADEYSGEADDGEAAVGRSSRADAWEWYGESQGEPVPVSVAAGFVDVVLRQAEEMKPMVPPAPVAHARAPRAAGRKP
jgi:hypothetical protein